MRMINDNNERVFMKMNSIEKIKFDASKNLIKNTEDYYNLFEVMIGKDRWIDLNYKKGYYDITGLGIGNILREGGEDSNGKTWIVAYYLVTKIENDVMEVVVAPSVKALNKAIELYGIERLAEME